MAKSTWRPCRLCGGEEYVNGHICSRCHGTGDEPRCDVRQGSHKIPHDCHPPKGTAPVSDTIHTIPMRGLPDSPVVKAYEFHDSFCIDIDNERLGQRAWAYIPRKGEVVLRDILLERNPLPEPQDEPTPEPTRAPVQVGDLVRITEAAKHSNEQFIGFVGRVTEVWAGDVFIDTLGQKRPDGYDTSFYWPADSVEVIDVPDSEFAVGDEVTVHWRTWEGTGVVEAYQAPYYHVRMTSGLCLGQVGGFCEDELGYPQEQPVETHHYVVYADGSDARING